ncbi:phosphoserine phosphatase [Fulvimarina manganoxydans]|uniref:Phosphoserine phosphatase n=1 Tax=Fulvimarina manganoxydans TaxID=937218 RepID=A0A1W1ZSV9_9HYPH|nr:phosphoserine phosphatase SerB [Fulvimarina manganoxydans]SMC51446.1 phosphoserine phosphatase [Fulvimarina manganoxydans]
MFVATLIAAPAGPGLDRQLVSDIAALIGADLGQADWLSETHAVDLPVGEAVAKPIVAKAQQLAWDKRADFVVQHAAGRRKSVLLADMDSTMIEQECIDELAAEIGIKEAVAGITARAMNGEIDFEPALRERVALLKGLSESVIAKVIDERITLASGGPTLIATMRANGAYTALVSGGFTAFTRIIAARLGFDENRANVLLAEDGALTGFVAEPILGADAKVTALEEVSAARGLSLSKTIAVGDGANDLPMLLKAGSGVALHAKPSVAIRAPHRVDHGDLTALLYLQGYRQSEFVPA